MRSDTELKFEKARKLLSMGKLDKKSAKFVESLKKKKDIGKITKRQYDYLTNIVQEKYKEVSIFRGIKEEAEPDPKLKIYNIKQESKSDDWFDNL
jgi:hypothetical protein